MPEDLRVRVALEGKAVNLAQLDGECGGHGLVASDIEVVAVEGSPVTEVALRDAIAAHDPDPLFGVSVDRQRLHEAVVKADAILAAPATAADWTAIERKVILAAAVKNLVGGT